MLSYPASWVGRRRAARASTRRITLRAVAVALCATAARGQELLSIAHGQADFDAFGLAATAVGDLDGDGIDDLLVGAPFASTIHYDEGAAYVLSGATRVILFAWHGVVPEDQLGFAVAALDDLDGDGVNDLLIGMPNQAGSAQTGSAFIRSGSSGVLLGTLSGHAAGVAFGAALAALPDLNADGVGEFAVGAPGGSSYSVYDGATITEIYRVTGLQSASGFGWSLAGAGDIDQDGVVDVLVGAPYWRDASGIVTGRVTVRSGVDGSVLRIHVGENASAFTNDYFGSTIANVGDVDADGCFDYVIGAWGYGSCQEGRIYVYSGATGAELLQIDGTACGETCGATIAAAGDVDHDGVPDLQVGDPLYGVDQRGRVRLISLADGHELSFAEGLAGDRLGTAVTAACDLEHDGIVDLLVSAVGPVDNFVGAVSRYACLAPAITAMTPARGDHLEATTVRLDGAAYRLESGFVVEVEGVAQSNVNVIDSTRCDFDVAAGPAGPALITVRNVFGANSATFQRTPATSVTGDLVPGGSGTWTTLVDVGDGVLLLAGLLPQVAVPVPPYDGLLAILPYTVVWIEPAAVGDQLALDFDIEDDASLSGITLLAQALAGPRLGGKDKSGSWSNVIEVTIQ